MTVLLKDGCSDQHTMASWGAGAKSAALAARVHILSELGFEGPRLTIYEQRCPAAAWKGSGGYTDGFCQLGTSPGKDIVFPLDGKGLGGEEYRRRAFKKYSFYSYRRDQILRNPEKQKLYNDRINQDGILCTNTVEHREFAEYLQDCYELSGANVVIGKIVAATPKDGRWELTVEHPDGRKQAVHHDSLLITGTGAPRRPVVDPYAEDLFFDARDLYPRSLQFKQVCAETEGPILIYGSGESAGSAVLYAGRIAGPKRQIIWLSTTGLPLERTENRDVNQLYSSPASGSVPWSKRARSERQELIRKTDRGVVSPKVLRGIEAMPNVSNDRGRIKRVERAGQHIVRAIHEDGSTLEGAAIISGIGFDPWSFAQSIEGAEFQEELSEKYRPALEDRIRHDLSLDWSGPKLYVPMLAGLAQGPGMPNLSCLGTISQRILDPIYERFESTGASRPVHPLTPHNMLQEAR